MRKIGFIADERINSGLLDTEPLDSHVGCPTLAAKFGTAQV